MPPPFPRGCVGKISLSLLVLVFAQFLFFRGGRETRGDRTARAVAGEGDSGRGGQLRATNPTGPIPACARDVVVALRGDGGDHGRECRGLLLRDDLVLTSRACAAREFTFDFADFGPVRAIPHPALTARAAAVDPRLGFLVADPPYHYYSLHEPVRRARLFLSARAAPIVNGTEADASVTCGEGQEPIAHSFLVDDSPVPLGGLRGVVPVDVLWEHTDLGTAVVLEHKSRLWWARPVTLSQAQETMKELLERYRGPPGSVSFPFTRDDFVGRASALCEIVDPRGHRLHICFMNYLRRWRRAAPFSGLPFFEWLDFGPGKLLLETEMAEKALGGNGTVHRYRANRQCQKKYFNRKKVHYFTDEERRVHEVYFEPSASGAKLIARYKHNGEVVPRSDKKKPLMYMWDLDQKFYMVNMTRGKGYGGIKHSGIVAGAPALSGGVAYSRDAGEIWGLGFSSGHYHPDVRAAALLYQWMRERGFNLTSVVWIGRQDWSTADCRDTDWRGVRLPGFEAAALNRSCHEVTRSPTWILRKDV